MTKEALIKKIEAYLKVVFKNNQNRLKHIQNVKKVAISLAKIYNVDLAGVIVASLLHDVTKALNFEENKKIIDGHDIDISQIPDGCIHAITSRIIAKEKFNITDQDILNAIEYHCSGRKNMSTLEKIIFISDYIEDSRPFTTEELKLSAKQDLDKTVFKIMLLTKAYLLENNKAFSKLTEEAIDSYKRKFGGI